MACESQLAVLPTTVRVKNERNRPCTVDPKNLNLLFFQLSMICARVSETRVTENGLGT